MNQIPAQQGLFVGVDVGGTKVAAGLVDANGEITSQTRVPMVSTASAEEGLRAVLQAITEVIPDGEAQVGGIGICAPGPLDPTTGVILNPPNVPCWRDFPLAEEVQKVHRVPVRLDNDANAAALAEARWGAGRGYPSVFYVTIGTGIGTGIVFDGRIYHGRTGAAGEGGHVTINYQGPRCGCGKRGCIEVLASGPAIARRAQDKLRETPSSDSELLHLAKGNINKVTSEMVGQAYGTGDAVAKEVLRETVELLSVWLGNMVDLLEPDVMIIGGGVASILAPLFEEIRERIPACSVNSR